MRIFLLIVIAMHGLIHLMGFAKAFNLAELSQLSKAISKFSGLMWLSAALLFLTTLVLLVLKSDTWWMFGVAAIIISQIVIINSWSDAKWGTIANIIILILIILAFSGNYSSSEAHSWTLSFDQRDNANFFPHRIIEKTLREIK